MSLVARRSKLTTPLKPLKGNNHHLPANETIRGKIIDGLKKMSERDKDEIFSKLPNVAATVNHLTYSNVFTVAQRPIIFVHDMTMNDGTVVDINMAFYKSTGESRFTGLDDTWLPTLGFDHESGMLVKAEEYFLFLYHARGSLPMSNVELPQVQDLLTYKRFITQKLAMVSYFLSHVQVPYVPPEYTSGRNVQGGNTVKNFAKFVKNSSNSKKNANKNVKVLKMVGGGSSLISKRRGVGLGLKLEVVPDIILDFEPLLKYYHYKIEILSKDGEGKFLGKGADKEVYKIETNVGPKAEVKFKSPMKMYNLRMIYKHLEVLKRYLVTGGEDAHSFVIPKLYKDATNDNPVEMIMDLVPATCLARNKKLNDNAVIRDFLAFCANVGVEPIDVEYCVDDDGKLYFYDFGNITIDKKKISA